MKLVINYDLIDKILDAREPFGPLKIIRKHKKEWMFFRIPFIASLNILAGPKLPQTLNLLILYSGMDLALDVTEFRLEKKDKYAADAKRELGFLVEQFKGSHIDTSYDLLLESKEDKRRYKIKLNEKKRPCILEEKYILVPTYTHTNDVKETSLLQEHVIGSKEWALSLGSPSKQKKLVPVHANM